MFPSRPEWRPPPLQKPKSAIFKLIKELDDQFRSQGKEVSVLKKKIKHVFCIINLLCALLYQFH